MKKYEALTKECGVDFVAFPQFVPDGNNGFRVVSKRNLSTSKNRRKRNGNNLWQKMFRRLRNLWLLSAFRPRETGEKGNRGDTIAAVIKKDIPTIKHKLAIIIPPEKNNEFAPQKDNGETAERIY